MCDVQCATYDVHWHKRDWSGKPTTLRPDHYTLCKLLTINFPYVVLMELGLRTLLRLPTSNMAWNRAAFSLGSLLAHDDFPFFVPLRWDDDVDGGASSLSSSCDDPGLFLPDFPSFLNGRRGPPLLLLLLPSAAPPVPAACSREPSWPLATARPVAT